VGDKYSAEWVKKWEQDVRGGEAATDEEQE
jgi:hypothetical protein